MLSEVDLWSIFGRHQVEPATHSGFMKESHGAPMVLMVPMASLSLYEEVPKQFLFLYCFCLSPSFFSHLLFKMLSFSHSLTFTSQFPVNVVVIVVVVVVVVILTLYSS